MRLIELEPRWCNDYGASDGLKQGITFLCPHCRARRLGVFFDAPICGSPPVDIQAINERRKLSDGTDDHLKEVHVGSVLWHREGDSFENLTLTPSIDASKFGCWHGFITNGEVT